MPESDRHRTVTDLFHAFPEVAGDISAEALGKPVPHGVVKVRAAPAESSFVASKEPAAGKNNKQEHVQSQKLTADNVVEFLDKEDKPLLGIVVETQLDSDDEKFFRWDLYYDQTRDRLNPKRDLDNEVPVQVMVLTPDKATAKWANRTIKGARADFSFHHDSSTELCWTTPKHDTAGLSIT